MSRPAKKMRPLARRKDSRKRLHGRALAGAVAAEQRQRPLPLQREVDVEQDLARAVEGAQRRRAGDPLMPRAPRSQDRRRSPPGCCGSRPACLPPAPGRSTVPGSARDPEDDVHVVLDEDHVSLRCSHKPRTRSIMRQRPRGRCRRSARRAAAPGFEREGHRDVQQFLVAVGERGRRLGTSASPRVPLLLAHGPACRVAGSDERVRSIDPHGQ